MLTTTITMDQFLQSIIDTIYMVGVSLFFGTILGAVLAILLVVTRPGGILECKPFYVILNPIVNIVRSVPFIILMVAIIPFTRLLVHTSIGTAAAIVPLIIYIGPYISRLIENSLLDVSEGIVEAARSMGASSFQTIWHFLLPEAMGSIILSLTTAAIGLLGATAMAGVVGGGGVGDVAITYGYQRFDSFAILLTVIVLVLMVQVLQSIGNWLSNKFIRG